MHNYVVEINVPKNLNAIVPISMHQEYHSGNKLHALIRKLKELECKNITIIIADWLRRWDDTEMEALKFGDNFLAENSHLFLNMNVVRWKSWIEANKEEVARHKEKLLSIYKSSDIFKKKIERTAKSAILHRNMENSLNYLLEECAVFLTFTEFDIHIYPQPISSIMSYLYILFPNFKLPQYKQAIIKVRNHELRNVNNLPLIARTVYGPLEDVLTSSEVHDKTKGILINRLFNLIVTVYAKLNFEGKEPIEDIFSGIDWSHFKEL